MRLIIAGIVQGEDYLNDQLKSHIDGDRVRYIGPVGVVEKNALFGQAAALLDMNTIPERFWLVLAEANCAGVPVIAMDLGSSWKVTSPWTPGWRLTNRPTRRFSNPRPE